MTQAEKREREMHAYELLHKWLKPGDTVYSVLRHVSQSGMQRRIDFYTIGEDRRPLYLTGYMEAIGLGRRRKTKDGLVVNGCGMDMGFDLVTCLSRALFKDHDRPDYVLNHAWL